MAKTTEQVTATLKCTHVTVIKKIVVRERRSVSNYIRMLVERDLEARGIINKSGEIVTREYANVHH